MTSMATTAVFVTGGVDTAPRAGSELRPHPHNLLARPLQASSSGISPVGSYATAITF
jgi:hypothetical protein